MNVLYEMEIRKNPGTQLVGSVCSVTFPINCNNSLLINNKMTMLFLDGQPRRRQHHLMGRDLIFINIVIPWCLKI